MGEISLTAVWNFIKRVKYLKKPIRIFYISDYDPAGENMPISVSRKIEFFLRKYRLNKKLDIKLKPLMLTRQQVKDFNLPSVPIDSAAQNKRFANFHSSYAAELHALEIANPGYAQQLVAKNLTNYFDAEKLNNAAKIANTTIDRFRLKMRTITTEYGLRPDFIDAIQNLISDCGLGLETDGPWLLDSQRRYLKQLAFYNTHRLR